MLNSNKLICHINMLLGHLTNPHIYANRATIVTTSCYTSQEWIVSQKQDETDVEDGCCPFKIVFDVDLCVVFDEDLYVHFICILLCFKYVLGSA